MNRQKRYAGRAIRKRQREQRAALDEFSKIDFPALAAQMADVIASFASVFGEVLATLTTSFNEFVAAHQANVEREYRMTHRALTTGTPELSAQERADVDRFGIHDDESEGVW